MLRAHDDGGCYRQDGVVMKNTTQTTAPASEEAFLDEKQILTRVPVSRRTLFNLRASGKIPFVRLGRRNLFHWPSVEAALLRHQSSGGIE